MSYPAGVGGAGPGDGGGTRALFEALLARSSLGAEEARELAGLFTPAMAAAVRRCRAGATTVGRGRVGVLFLGGTGTEGYPGPVDVVAGGDRRREHAASAAEALVLMEAAEAAYGEQQWAVWPCRCTPEATPPPTPP